MKTPVAVRAFKFMFRVSSAAGYRPRDGPVGDGWSIENNAKSVVCAGCDRLLSTFGNALVDRHYQAVSRPSAHAGRADRSLAHQEVDRPLEDSRWDLGADPAVDIGDGRRREPFQVLKDERAKVCSQRADCYSVAPMCRRTLSAFHCNPGLSSMRR